VSALRWARQSPRHVAHLVWADFATPEHGVVGADEGEYVTACGQMLAAQELKPEHGDWKQCRHCQNALVDLL
jgi:hypothetical protein